MDKMITNSDKSKYFNGKKKILIKLIVGPKAKVTLKYTKYAKIVLLT